MNPTPMDPKEYVEEIDFEKYWLVLKRRWFVTTLVFGIVTALAALASYSKIPVYQATGQLLFKADRSSSLTGLQNDQLGQLNALSKTGDPLATQAQIIISRPIAQTTANVLHLTDAKGNPLSADTILGNLSVKPVTGTDILQISYVSKDPKLSAAIVNQVMQTYLKSNVQTNRAEAVAARQFILQQLPDSEAAVGKAESALRLFKENNGVVVLQEEASATVATISALDREITDAQAQLAETTARSAGLRNRVGTNSETAVNISSLNQSPGVQEALTQLQTIQTQLATERAKYREGHPVIANLERQEASLQTLLQQRVGQVLGSNQQVPVGRLQIGNLRQTLISDYVQSEISRMGLIRKINQLSSAQNFYQARSRVMPGLEKSQRELERKLTAAQTTYETLLTKLQEVQVTENQTIGNARVISQAEIPTNPINASKTLALGGGSLVGLLLGIAAAFLLDLTDSSVKNLKEAKDLFKYTLLGVIPYLDRPGSRDADAPGIVAIDFPNSLVQEAYQMLGANLKFLSSDKELKTIVITSSVSREGKSEVAASLAAAIAQVNRRVLLVDANLRHPTQHHAWNLTNAVGLSNLIVGQVKSNEAIQIVMPNLHILPAGTIPPNPIALLDSTRMDSLVKAFSNNYDFVIFDTPALAGTADPAILGKMTDGVLLVVRPGVVDSARGKAAKEFLKQTHQNVLGIVINGVNVKSEPDSYFYYTHEERVVSGQNRSTTRA
jgi:polysaccharide biosynthesis transport protein